VKLIHWWWLSAISHEKREKKMHADDLSPTWGITASGTSWPRTTWRDITNDSSSALSNSVEVLRLFATSRPLHRTHVHLENYQGTIERFGAGWTLHCIARVYRGNFPRRKISLEWASDFPFLRFFNGWPEIDQSHWSLQGGLFELRSTSFTTSTSFTLFTNIFFKFDQSAGVHKTATSARLVSKMWKHLRMRHSRK